MITKLLQGNLIQFVKMLVVPTASTNDIRIRYDLPIFGDTDQVNQERRIKLYLKLRELLLRMIPEVVMPKKLFCINNGSALRKLPVFNLEWDLTKRLSQERILGELLECYEKTLMFKNIGARFLPKIEEISRTGMQARL